MTSNPKCWMTCRDCGHRTITRRSFIQRRSPLICSKCGGRLTPSAAASAALVLGMDRRREMAMKAEADQVVGSPDAQDLVEELAPCELYARTSWPTPQQLCPNAARADTPMVPASSEWRVFQITGRSKSTKQTESRIVQAVSASAAWDQVKQQMAIGSMTEITIPIAPVSARVANE